MSEATLEISGASTVDPFVDRIGTGTQESGVRAVPTEEEARRRFEEEVQCAESLMMQIEQGSESKATFELFCASVDGLTEQGWFHPAGYPAMQQRYEALLEKRKHWGNIYFHLHLANECREALSSLTTEDTPESPMEANYWRKLQHHVEELAGEETYFTVVMETRVIQLRHAFQTWKEIHDKLYFGGEAAQVVSQRFSPDDIHKLWGQVNTLNGSALYHVAYPLQRTRALRLQEQCVTLVRNVFGHDPLPPLDPMDHCTRPIG